MITSISRTEEKWNTKAILKAFLRISLTLGLREETLDCLLAYLLACGRFINTSLQSCNGKIQQLERNLEDQKQRSVNEINSFHSTRSSIELLKEPPLIFFSRSTELIALLSFLLSL